MATSPVHAQTDQIVRGEVPSWVRQSDLLPVPDDANGAVFVRRQDVLIHLNDTGQEQYLGYRIKLLHANALQAGNISLAWNPAAGVPTVHAVRVHRGDEMIDVLEQTSFEVLRREDQLETAHLDGILTAVLRVPDLRVGDELEVAVTTLASDPSLGKMDAGMLFMAPSPAAGRYRMGLSWEASRDPSVQLTPDMQKIAVRRGRSLEIRLDNPPVVSPPKDAPPRYQWMRTIEFTDFGDWESVSRHFAPLFRKASQLQPDSPVKREADRIAAAHSNPMQRAQAALKLVQQDVRYIYVGLDGGNLTPATAEQTWQRRYGDCKGKTTLLMALLAELGIDAEPVLVNSSGADDGFDQRLPSPRLFDHVLVRARIDGKSYWLDGTLPPVASPAHAPVFPYEWVLPLTDRGNAIEQLAWTPASVPDEIVLHEIDARSGFDEPAQITSTTISRGIKGLQAQVQFSALTRDQILTGLRQELVGNTWQSIDDVRWYYDQKQAASVLTISGTGTVDWNRQDDGGRSLALPGGGFNPPEKRIRATEQDQSLPFWSSADFSCHVTTVRLPRDTKPVQWSSKANFDTRIFGRNYYRAFDLRDGAIRMIRSARIEQREIDAAAAQRDNARIPAFDNSMGWITYTPDGTTMSVGNGQHVPATYERDWSNEDVPCSAANSQGHDRAVNGS
jgi:transglutaminase-like putative cysteine protease